jgi:thiol-disulfide isomerase/thioredoxin
MDVIQASRFKGVLFLGGGLLLGLFLAAAALFMFAPAAKRSATPPATGKTVPDFTLRSIDGGEVKLADLKGTPVVINFWATWCPPCQGEMPLLDSTARRLNGKVVFLAIDYDEKAGDVEAYAATNGLSLPILLDPGGKVAERFYVFNFPTTFFIDSEGVLRAQHIGQLDAPLLDQYLETAGYSP